MATLVHPTIGLIQSSLYLSHLYESYFPAAALITASLVVALGLVVASISLVCHPGVYIGSRVVDRMMSTSAYRRFTFGWCSDIPEKIPRHDNQAPEEATVVVAEELEQ